MPGSAAILRGRAGARPAGSPEAPRSAEESASQPPGRRARRLLPEPDFSREAGPAPANTAPQPTPAAGREEAAPRRGGPGKGRAGPAPPRRFPEAPGAGRRRVGAMADPGRLERLERRVRELEDELAREKRGRAVARARIDTMSAEVTDSNPYRCAEGCEALSGLCRMPKGEAVGWNDGSGGAGEVRTGGNLRDEDGFAQEGVGQCRRQVLREGCSRVSHLAGLAGLDVRVTLYYLALQCRRLGRKSENLVFFSEVASK